MSTGANSGKQERKDGQQGGDNLADRNHPPVSPMHVPNVFGPSGQPNNQSTKRPKGST